MNIPKDPVMLLSFVNTHLRDNNCSLIDFCNEHNLILNEIEVKLSSINYHYDEKTNQFI